VLRAARDYGSGHLLAVAQPDSRAQAQQLADLPMLQSFGQVLPQR
jgi:hypothetical protein